ncbi:MAG: DJ-1/PfpI family protein, partial [Actinobacteria bacterium]|nr:DJ-1/PfpI family protein [Actinomycetota bacterium]
RIVRGFCDDGRIVAAICHAPWILVEAGVARGRDMTSYHSIKTDVMNAGAHWRDEPVVVDNGIVTSRNPGDLDAFCSKILVVDGLAGHLLELAGGALRPAFSFVLKRTHGPEVLLGVSLRPA